MPNYRVITPLRRNRKTVPPGRTVTLAEDEAGELLRKRAVEPVEAPKPERPPVPPPAAAAPKSPGKPPATPKPAAKAAAGDADRKSEGETATTE